MQLGSAQLSKLTTIKTITQNSEHFFCCVFVIKAQVGLLIERPQQECHSAVLIVITALEQKVLYCETGKHFSDWSLLTAVKEKLIEVSLYTRVRYESFYWQVHFSEDMLSPESKQM